MCTAINILATPVAGLHFDGRFISAVTPWQVVSSHIEHPVTQKRFRPRPYLKRLHATANNETV
jgi:hypothetical protein